MSSIKKSATAVAGYVGRVLDCLDGRVSLHARGSVEEAMRAGKC